jgi:hypothetical protein
MRAAPLAKFARPVKDRAPSPTRGIDGVEIGALQRRAFASGRWR